MTVLQQPQLPPPQQLSRERNHKPCILYQMIATARRRLIVRRICISCITILVFVVQPFLIGNIVTTCARLDQQDLSLWWGDPARFDVGKGYQYHDIPRERHRGSITSAKMNSVDTIELVVAYCHADLSWLKHEIDSQFPSHVHVNINIMSKCGNETNVPNFMDDHQDSDNDNINTNTNTYTNTNVIKSVNIVPLKNVGGCDYAYLHFINRYFQHQTIEKASSTLLFFIKDTPRSSNLIHQPGYLRTFHEMYTSASSSFVCGMKPSNIFSAFHDLKYLRQFSLNNYIRFGKDDKSLLTKFRRRQRIRNGVAPESFNRGNYGNLGDFMDRELLFLDKGDIDNDNGGDGSWTRMMKDDHQQLVQVCYGGVFALPATTLLQDKLKVKETFFLLEKMLEDASSMSIVEHFIERLWASLLAEPLDGREMERVLQMSTKVTNIQQYAMGMLTNKFIPFCLA